MNAVMENQKNYQMKILINLVHIQPGLSGGIGQYVKYLTEAILRQFPEVEVHLLENPYNYKHFCRAPEGANCHRHLVRNVYQITSILSEEIRKIAPQVVLCPVPGDTVERQGNEKYILGIADMQHEIHPEWFTTGDLQARRMAYGHQVVNSDSIITLSQHARQSVLDHYFIPGDKVAVVPPAMTPEFTGKPEPSMVEEVLQKYGLRKGGYLFFPANFWFHKNHERLFQALAKLKKQGNNYDLVLTGHDMKNADQFKSHLEELGIAESVKHLGYLSTDEMQCVFSAASALIFPSMYEGFGIPVLEAFALEVPVCCSNRTSLPEVAGDAALYFDPESVDEIAAAIENISESEGLRKTLRFNGQLRVKEYSYEKSAEVLMDLAHNLIHQTDSGQNQVEELPLVSIVTPSYNQGIFIRRTIDSVLSQDYPNIELIVFDGGSTDETVSILKSYGDQFFWVSEPDNGQTDAINKGLKRAKGTILAYLNSDDTLEPGCITKVVNHFKQYPYQDLLYGRANYIDEDDETLREYPTRPWNFDYFIGECTICQPAAFWTRRTIERFGSFDATYDMAMDYEYWMRIVVGGGAIHYLDEFLANSREYAATKTQSAHNLILKDIFRLSRQYLGSVSYNWCLNHAYYIVNNPLWFSRWLGERNQQRLMHLIARTYRFCLNTDPWLDRFRHFFKVRGFKKNSAVAPAISTLTGFFSDGWVAPILVKTFPVPTFFDRLLIEGMSPVPNQLEISVNGKAIGTKELFGGGEDFSIELDVPEELSMVRTIEIKSETCHTLPAPDTRDVTFILNFTNYFDDNDFI